MSNTMKIEFTCDNAAFFDDDEKFDTQEVVQILHRISTKIQDGQDGGVIRDINGNKVGEWYLTVEGQD